MISRTKILDYVTPGGIGVELGVAEGEFSEAILKTKHLNYLYSIDMWAGDRNHNITEYKNTVKRLMPYQQHNSILRMKFDEAIDLFDDNSLDFVYVDGYAHTGQENGQTISDWYAKVKPGGIFAGDDYSLKWPKTIKAVDQFISDYKLDLKIIECGDPTSKWGRSPTWWVEKS